MPSVARVDGRFVTTAKIGVEAVANPFVADPINGVRK